MCLKALAVFNKNLDEETLSSVHFRNYICLHFEHKQLHPWMSFNAEVIYEALSSKSLFADLTSAIVPNITVSALSINISSFAEFHTEESRHMI